MGDRGGLAAAAPGAYGQRLRLCRASQVPKPKKARPVCQVSRYAKKPKAEAKPAVVPQETDPPLSAAVAPQEEPKPAESKPAVAPQEAGALAHAASPGAAPAVVPHVSPAEAAFVAVEPQDSMHALRRIMQIDPHEWDE